MTSPHNRNLTYFKTKHIFSNKHTSEDWLVLMAPRLSQHTEHDDKVFTELSATKVHKFRWSTSSHASPELHLPILHLRTSMFTYLQPKMKFKYFRHETRHYILHHSSQNQTTTPSQPCCPPFKLFLTFSEILHWHGFFSFWLFTNTSRAAHNT